MSDEFAKMPDDREIEERFRQLQQSLLAEAATAPELEGVDEKLEEILEKTQGRRLSDEEHQQMLDRLDTIEQRLATARNTKKKTENQTESLSGALDRSTAISMGYGLSLAYTIVGTPLVGYGIGLLIDKATGKTGWSVWLTLIGAILGIAWVVMVTSRNADRMP